MYSSSPCVQKYHTSLSCGPEVVIWQWSRGAKTISSPLLHYSSKIPLRIEHHWNYGCCHCFGLLFIMLHPPIHGTAMKQQICIIGKLGQMIELFALLSIICINLQLSSIYSDMYMMWWNWMTMCILWKSHIGINTKSIPLTGKD